MYECVLLCVPVSFCLCTLLPLSHSVSEIRYLERFQEEPARAAAPDADAIRAVMLAS
jgi:hypothetical protein